VSEELYLGRFKAGYKRIGMMSITTGACEICLKGDVPTLYTDGSEGEYGGVHLCFRCLTNAFMRYDRGERKPCPDY
jgi:hypothetical protein